MAQKPQSSDGGSPAIDWTKAEPSIQQLREDTLRILADLQDISKFLFEKHQDMRSLAKEIPESATSQKIHAIVGEQSDIQKVLSEKITDLNRIFADRTPIHTPFETPPDLLAVRARLHQELKQDLAGNFQTTEKPKTRTTRSSTVCSDGISEFTFSRQTSVATNDANWQTLLRSLKEVEVKEESLDMSAISPRSPRSQSPIIIATRSAPESPNSAASPRNGGSAPGSPPNFATLPHRKSDPDVKPPKTTHATLASPKILRLAQGSPFRRKSMGSDEWDEVKAIKERRKKGATFRGLGKFLSGAKTPSNPDLFQPAGVFGIPLSQLPSKTVGFGQNNMIVNIPAVLFQLSAFILPPVPIIDYLSNPPTSDEFFSNTLRD
eukprot:TRINITY_DN10632_c0_g1_i2.p1 TRINITY_DN10632_c0_g1~~TRINITY_DN10632_c0_g1_i2.p1  ORF type:complete len:378 (-),score=109.20 TRINITY_DN10632_c0_g1_i2:645-1778(-)